MISSIDRKLKRNKYPVQIMQENNTNHFQLTRDALKAKQRTLKKWERATNQMPQIR